MLIDFFFPQVCGICGKLDKNSICNKCEKILADNSKFEEFIENNEFYKLIYIFKYGGIIRKLILDYKFNEKAYIYKTFVNFVLKNQKMFENLKSYDTIIPVPISKKRMRQRGYNQSLLIAKEIGKRLKIEVLTKCLIKNKDIIEQSKLNREQRIKNIQNVYDMKNKQIIENKKILLVDDIYTTGSTVKECLKTLKKANPKEIDVLVLAKD